MSMPFRATLRASCLSVAVSAALLSPLSRAAHAEDDVLADAPTLDDVVVTGVAPVSPLTWVTDPRLPRQPVPASDGADYLKTIPGFGALRNGGTNGDPVLRGLSGSRLNLVTNGGAMPGSCPARMDNPLSYVSPETFDRLIVVKGPQTVLWGPGASAGTVRFERDVERFDAPGVRARGSLLGGSFGRNDQVLSVEAGTTVGYARISGNRSESDDYRDGDGQRVPSSWEKWNADAALGWTPGDDTLLELSLGAGDGEARYAGRGMDGSQFRRDSQSLRFEKGGFDGALSKIEASAYRNAADHVMDNYTLRDPNQMGPMPMPMAANVERRTVGGRVAASWSVERFDATLGIDAQDGRHRQRSAAGRGAYLAEPWDTDARFAQRGVFGEGNWHAGEGQHWIAGARLDRAEATDRRATAGMMGMPNPTFGQTRSETLASAFVRHEREFSRHLQAYAGIGRSERMPDYWELFSPDMGPMGSANAFAGVAPETTIQLDVGVHYRSARVDAWASAYAGRVDDFILFTYAEGGMMGTTTRVGNVDARIHGAEAGVEFRPAERWKLGGTVAWAWGENRDDGTPLPQMTPLEARLTAGYEHARWNVGALLRVVSSQDRVAPMQGNVVGRDLDPTPGFATLAVNGGYRFSDRVRLTAGIDNVFDRTYAEHLNLAGSADFGYPADPVRIHEPGRSAWLKLDLRY
ncbi:MAG: TonB-dependent copper receptor [Proteobacteria bacterium]|nr:TonB-dependent copper receptor [Pseudomonadota bacterium]